MAQKRDEAFSSFLHRYGIQLSDTVGFEVRVHTPHLMPLRNPPLFLSAFPMFVPSVSW